jgi:hypothetical protein
METGNRVFSLVANNLQPGQQFLEDFSHWRLTRAWMLSQWVEFPRESAFQRQNEFKDWAVLWVI